MDPTMADLSFGYDAPDVQAIMELQKALEAGHPVPTYAGGGSGSPLVPQSIESSLAWATFKQEHVALWKIIPKSTKKLLSTVHEYTRQESLGPELDLNMGEGDIGPSVDSEFTRHTGKVRYFSHERTVSDPMALLATIGNPNAIQKVNQDGALWTTMMLEDQLVEGDDSIHPYQINGLRRVCTDVAHVKDVRGDSFNSDVFHDLISELVDPPNWGAPTTILLPTQIKTDAGKIGGAHVRFTANMGQMGGNGQVKLGTEATGIIGPIGDVPFVVSSFLARTRKVAPTVAAGEVIPATPAYTTQPTAAAAAASKFVAADAGSYKYDIVAVGPKGRTAPVESNAVTVAAGDKVTMVITAPAALGLVNYYRIYRTKAGAPTGTKWIVGKVTANVSGGAPANTTFVDRNDDLPDTMEAYILQIDPEVLEWKPLLDFARIPQPRRGLRQPFAFVLYGMMQYRIPKRLYRVKNIAAAT